MQKMPNRNPEIGIRKMNSLANFFDHPLEKKTQAMEIPPPEISASPTPAGQCPCDSLWLDAYGIWRCEICFPPIFENEIRERKNSGSKNLPAKIPPAEIPAQEKPTEEISLVRFLPRYFFNDEFLWSRDNPQNQEPPCEVCNSLDFFWNLRGERFCRKCHPKKFQRSRELIELAAKIRTQSKPLKSELAKLEYPTK